MHSYIDAEAGETVFIEASPTTSHGVRLMRSSYSAMGERMEFKPVLLVMMRRGEFL